MHNHNKRVQTGVAHLVALLLTVVLAGIGFAGWKVYQSNKSTAAKSASGQSVGYDQAASKTLTNGNCSGTGSVKIGPPMPIAQIGFIQPYGSVVGGHVTPIDHQYYTGLNPAALRDTYDVIAPADGRIVDIEHRGSVANTPLHSVDIPSSDEYRLVMMHTCSFLTYVDLVTSLDNNIKSKLPAGWNPLHGGSGVNIPIKKGEIVGHIGGQTLDFAVWDLAKKLTGFVNPSSYQAEAWKIFTAPTSNYLDPSIKTQVVAKYLRTAAPIDGKIDYDIDGKLVGTWFLEGSGGYHSSSNTVQNYWTGHLSIAPDYLDPTVYVASIGDYYKYPGAVSTRSGAVDAEQFMIKNASPDPAVVGVSDGLVKYELQARQYVLPDGNFWNVGSFATGMKATAGYNSSAVATVLAQLTANRTLKFEVFPGKTAAQVSAFDSGARTYTR